MNELDFGISAGSGKRSEKSGWKPAYSGAESNQKSPAKSPVCGRKRLRQALGQPQQRQPCGAAEDQAPGLRSADGELRRVEGAMLIVVIGVRADEEVYAVTRKRAVEHGLVM